MLVCPSFAGNLGSVLCTYPKPGIDERIGGDKHQLRLPLANGGKSAYSVRNARIGSIRDALHAGTRQARAATNSSVAATAAKIAGSNGWVP